MNDRTKAGPAPDEDCGELRDINEALLISSVTQHGLTERAERAEAALRESEQSLRLALDSAELGTFHVDAVTNALTSDQRFRAIFGSVGEPMTYEQAFVSVHPDDRVRIREARAAADRLYDPVPFQAEFRVVHTDGSVRWVFAKGRTKFSDEGPARTLVSFDGMVGDITELKVQALQLAEHERRKDEFLAMLGHELRNPLASIRTATHLLRLQAHGTETQIQQQVRTVIERQVGTLTRLVDDLLDVSRMLTGKMRLVMATVDLCQVLRHALDTATSVMEPRRHQVSVALPDGPVWVNADATRLEQVIVNLIHNATKFTDEGGGIRLIVVRHPDRAELRVSDSGIGISPEMLEHVFELFTQADGSLARAAGGMGVGLSLVQRIVALHGGTVEARSPGVHQGSEFIVSLPAAPAPARLSEQSASAAEPGTEALRVLVVDDNADACAMLAKFVRLMGHTVETASGGAAAISAAEDSRPDVVLLDIGLPGVSGFEVASRLRADPANSAMRLVAVTGYGRERDLERGREAGFDLHLVKPVDLMVLEQLLTNYANHTSR